ncbi:hypothetical protein [Staphylococcus argenteus]|uniref:Putative membrane protein n=1 Tax=Staphylococcus argenteus TaxID=985002 RepID=A0A7U7PWN5_9STAP|nr:hypothetical protein [Staphylococcus argenteus]BBN31449.1 hypothetical protein KUH140087_2322 [Staphylococcus aureus]API80165.1 hypothetical protein A7971_11075 [Staphylococcus argenteus]ATY57707.1 hypothetical protein CJ017_11020 [Staphylococcus argenteus]ATZ87930.1 hypothetical protein CKO49_11020 [Staphylococcus argenteus]EKF1504745.1 hypothetical protein [Staphylococcus argenteus]
MKNGPKLTLAIIGIFLILCEFFYGIPFLGAAFILSFGWQPLTFNALLYLILTIILLVNRQNAIRPIVIIPLIGLAGSFLAIIPFLGILIHWVLFFLMILFVAVVLSAPTYIPNKNARVIYTQYKDGHKE